MVNESKVKGLSFVGDCANCAVLCRLCLCVYALDAVGISNNGYVNKAVFASLSGESK